MQSVRKKVLKCKEKYLTGKNKCDNLAKVIDMEKIGRQVFFCMIFYGELLTEHQKMYMKMLYSMICH